MSHEARYLEIMRGLQESRDAVGAVIFARRYEGWADFGADGDPELLLDEIELLRSTLGLSEAVRTRRAVISKGTMMPLERRNEPQMLRQFQKMYPSYNLKSSAEEASPAAGGGLEL